MFGREVRRSRKSPKQGNVKRPWICRQITGNGTVAVGGLECRCSVPSGVYSVQFQSKVASRSELCAKHELVVCAKHYYKKCWQSEPIWLKWRSWERFEAGMRNSIDERDVRLPVDVSWMCRGTRCGGVRQARRWHKWSVNKLHKLTPDTPVLKGRRGCSK
jgi:hypothetical protein